MRRVRAQAPIDSDNASPESITAALEYVTGTLFEKANSLGVALDWNTFKVYTRRSGDTLLVTGWALVLK